MQSWDVIYESCIGLFVPHQAETGHPGIQSYRLIVMKIPATWKTVERENLEKTESKFKMECR